MYADRRPALYERRRELKWCLAIATQATKYVEFGVVSERVVFSHAVAIIASDSFGLFAVLSSSFHKAWARKYCSYNLALLRYSPSDLFETFPLPANFEGLENIGDRFYQKRRIVMIERGEGLTATYNRFHDQSEQSDDIARLRVLRMEMDHAVATAYDFNDLDLGHDFHKTKQGERFTISESARHAVLDRLLHLNHERYREEVESGLHAKGKSRSRVKTKGAAKLMEQPELLHIPTEDF
jgi:hypothetical protein